MDTLFIYCKSIILIFYIIYTFIHFTFTYSDTYPGPVGFLFTRVYWYGILHCVLIVRTLIYNNKITDMIISLLFASYVYLL